MYINNYDLMENDVIIEILQEREIILIGRNIEVLFIYVFSIYYGFFIGFSFF